MTQEEQIYSIEKILVDLLEKEQLERVSQYCSQQHPADLAEALSLMDKEEKQAVFRQIELDMAAEVLGHYEEDLRMELMQALEEESLTRVLEKLPPDDAADAVADLPDEKATRVLSEMSDEESEDIRDLLQYDEETAGGIMTSDVIAFPESMPVEEVLDAFRGTWRQGAQQKLPKDSLLHLESAYELIREENVYSIFVVDKEVHLLGYVRLQDLVFASPETRLAQIVQPDVVAVETHKDQEEVAELAMKYDLASIPVVDEQKRLVGRITIDDLMDVVEEETTEDILRMAGTSEDDLISVSAFRSMTLRLPWLLVALFGLLVSSYIYGSFKTDFDVAVFAQIAIFIPVIGGLSGNTGVQSATILIRGLATGQINIRESVELAWREVRVGLLLGSVFSMVIAAVALILPGVEPRMGWVVGVAVLSAVTWSSLLGVFIPTFLERIGKDPAVATGPVVTSLNDAMSALIYLSVALAML